jgi:hypothetical protein
MGMNKSKKKMAQSLTSNEEQLVKRLRRNPELMARIESIVDLAENAEGPLKTADEMEKALVDEIRRLGNETMHHWATRAEERVSEELKAEHPKVLSRKKKR